MEGIMQQFDIITRTSGEIIVFDLIGTLDAHTLELLEKKFREYVNQDYKYFIMNLSQLEYVTSAGLGVFMEYIEDIRAKGGDIIFCCARDRIYKIFDLLGFPVIFSFYPAEEKAIESITGNK